jgi:hypothetical protein
MAGSVSIPGASFAEGGTATRSFSGRSRALWADAWNAQFLWGLRRSPSLKDESSTYLMAETTPPLLILSLCSVNTVSFANGYSGDESCRSGFEGNGVKKKFRPVCDCVIVSG